MTFLHQDRRASRSCNRRLHQHESWSIVIPSKPGRIQAVLATGDDSGQIVASASLELGCCRAGFSRGQSFSSAATSTTCSPQASSHEDRCRPSLSAFSTTQRRWPNCRAQRINRRYSPRLASMRSDATGWFVCGSTAVAVCVLLWGAIPMTIIAGYAFLMLPVWVIASDNPTSRKPVLVALLSCLC